MLHKGLATTMQLPVDAGRGMELTSDAAPGPVLLLLPPDAVGRTMFS